jgi:RND family efflux transporter MFP subunit
MLKIMNVVLGIVLVGGLAGCDDGQAEKQAAKEPPAVLVQKIAFRSAASEQTFPATIRPRVTSDHAFRVSGKVTKRLVDVGDRVKAGTALAELDSADLVLQLSQAEAEVTAARKSLTQQSAERLRIEKLASKGWAAAATRDKQRVAVDEAEARLAKAAQNVALARNAITYSILKADSDGVVTETLLEPGQFAVAGQKAIAIARDGNMEALVAIPETLATSISKGNAQLSVWSDPSKRYDLKLRELSPLADAATRTFAARFSVINPDESLRLGMSAELHFGLNQNSSAQVPLSAIFDQGKGPGVWSVNTATGEITLKPVTVSSLGSATASISGGVKEGEMIVALGAQKLDPGLKVRPVDTLER